MRSGTKETIERVHLWSERGDKVSICVNVDASSGMGNEEMDMHEIIPSTSAFCVARSEPGISIVYGRQRVSKVDREPSGSSTPNRLLEPMASATGRPVVFMDINIGETPVGRIKMELFSDVVPKFVCRVPIDTC